MFKKFLGLAVCAVTLVCTLVPIQAAADTTYKTEVLRGLGVYQEDPVTYDNFINSLAGFLYDNPSQIGNAETIARTTGMIEKGEVYSGQSSLTVNKALKLAVITLGYKPILGSDGDYIKKAAELGISDGISGDGNLKLKTNVAVEILYNMLEAEPLVKASDGNAAIGNDNILSINRDIYEVKGILTGTDITSIYGEEGTAKTDYIKIDEIPYFVGDKNYDELLGKNVVAYMQKTDYLEDTALYVGEMENKNITLTIDCDDITDIGDSISYITYERANKRDERIDIIASPRVIYNGMFAEDYAEDDFRHGVLELIDNDRDGKYDVIKVSAYKTVIVESVVVREMLVKNRYKFDLDFQELNLNAKEDSDLKVKIFDSEGNEAEFSDIKVDNTLSVLMSRDKKLINIYISGNENIQGAVTGIYDAENIVEIDGEAYKKSEDLKKQLSHSQKTIKAGASYIFYIDYFGKIAYMKEYDYNNYSILVRVNGEDELDGYSIVHMDINGDWYTSAVSEKVKIDGEKPANLKTAMEGLKAEGPQVVILKFNAQNRIIDINKANDADFSKTLVENYSYCPGDRFFQSGTDVIYLEDNAKVVVIPSDNIKDEDNWKIYSAGSFFKEEIDYSNAVINCYNLDEFNFTDLFTIVQDSVSPDPNKALYVVTGFETTLVDGEPHTVINGSVDGFINLPFVLKSKDLLEDNHGNQLINKGDVINFSLDHNGMIDYIDMSTKFSFADSDFRYIVGNYAKSSRYAGIVSDINIEEGKMMLNCGTDGTGKTIYIPFRISSNMQVTVYDADEGCESMPINYVSKNDKLLIRVEWGKAVEIVCVKNQGGLI